MPPKRNPKVKDAGRPNPNAKSQKMSKTTEEATKAQAQAQAPDFDGDNDSNSINGADAKAKNNDKSSKKRKSSEADADETEVDRVPDKPAKKSPKLENGLHDESGSRGRGDSRNRRDVRRSFFSLVYSGNLPTSHCSLRPAATALALVVEATAGTVVQCVSLSPCPRAPTDYVTSSSRLAPIAVIPAVVAVAA